MGQFTPQQTEALVSGIRRLARATEDQNTRINNLITTIETLNTTLVANGVHLAAIATNTETP